MSEENANITVAQVAEVLDLPATTIRAFCKSKNMPFVKVGKNGIRFTQAQINEYVTRNSHIFKKPLSEYQVAMSGRSTRTVATPEGMLDVNQAAEILGLSIWTMRKITREGTIPAISGANNRKLYRKEDLEKALETGAVKDIRTAKPIADIEEGEQLMRIEEAANKVGMPIDTLRRMVREGECRCIRNNDKGIMWFTDEILEELLDDNGVELVPGVDWQSAVKVGDAAERLGVSTDEIRRLCNNGKLGYVTSFFGKRMFREEDLARYEAKRDGKEYVSETDEPYITQKSFDRDKRLAAERERLEQTMTPEELAEYDAKRAARKAMRDASREASRAERLGIDQEDEEKPEKETTPLAPKSPYEGMTILGVEGRGNVVSVYLGVNEMNPIWPKLNDTDNADEVWSHVMFGTDAIITIAWTLDTIVATDIKPLSPKRARMLIENRDLPVLALLDEEDYAGDTKATLAIAGASSKAVKWYFGDQFSMPDDAKLLAAEDWRETEDEEETEDKAETETQPQTETASDDDAAELKVIDGNAFLGDLQLDQVNGNIDGTLV